MLTFAVTLKKGGVGKTTLTANLAQVLGVCNKKILAIDNDEQHNLTKYLGLKKQAVDISDLYKGDMGIDEFIKTGIVQTNIDGVDCIPSSSRFAQIDICAKNRLKELLNREEIKSFYDFCIIDCPPGVRSIENKYAIEASDVFILPVEMKQFCVDGLVEMVKVLNENYKIDMEKIIIIPNMIRDYTKKHMEIIKTLKTIYPENVTESYIPYDEAIDNVVTEGKTLILNKASAKSTDYFINIVFEVFGLDESQVWDCIREKRKNEKATIAKKNFVRQNMKQLISSNA